MYASMTELRRREYSRLDAAGHVYLDYTGSGLYPESLVRAHAEHLLSGVYGNPHSHNPASQISTETVEATRARIRAFFRADPSEYEVVFTANASGALKLVGESYPFRAGSRYVMTADNHNSVNGIREFARRRDADVHYIPLQGTLRSDPVEDHLEPLPEDRPGLFAYPAQSNFSGVKHPLGWIETARQRGYDVLLDAAAFVPTNRLDLSAVKPDYACVSFYKMFGYPTGLGVLLARRAALAKLERPWFAGGTVRFVSAQSQVHVFQPTGEAFEDGTVDFLGIGVLGRGLDFLDGVDMDRVNEHVMGLTAAMLDGLASLRHRNGAPLVQVYGPADCEDRGSIVVFNLIDPAGTVVDPQVVEKRAAAANISLRTGTFCNPGTAECAFQLGEVDAYRRFPDLSPKEFAVQQFTGCLDEVVSGAVRASLGIASDAADIDRFLGFLREFLDAPAPLVPRDVPEFVGG